MRYFERQTPVVDYDYLISPTAELPFVKYQLKRPFNFPILIEYNSFVVFLVQGGNETKINIKRGGKTYTIANVGTYSTDVMTLPTFLKKGDEITLFDGTDIFVYKMV